MTWVNEIMEAAKELTSKRTADRIEAKRMFREIRDNWSLFHGKYNIVVMTDQTAEKWEITTSHLGEFQFRCCLNYDRLEFLKAGDHHPSQTMDPKRMAVWLMAELVSKVKP